MTRGSAFSVALVLVIAVLVVGAFAWAFLFIGTPQEQRALRLDLERVRRLEWLSRAIQDYAVRQEKPSLPEDLGQVREFLKSGYWEGFYGLQVLEDPQTGELFEYRRIGRNEYELCATFQTDFREQLQKARIGEDTAARWMHAKGRHCFRFTVTY